MLHEVMSVRSCLSMIKLSKIFSQFDLVYHHQRYFLILIRSISEILSTLSPVYQRSRCSEIMCQNSDINNLTKFSFIVFFCSVLIVLFPRSVISSVTLFAYGYIFTRLSYTFILSLFTCVNIVTTLSLLHYTISYHTIF